MESQPISVQLDRPSPEIIVRPAFYSLDGVIARCVWDAAVNKARAAGWYLVESLIEDIDPMSTFEVDVHNIEHHYLVRPEELEHDEPAH